MNDTTEPPRATIRARIHESAVKRVTRTYAATLPEILALCGIETTACKDQLHYA